MRVQSVLLFTSVILLGGCGVSGNGDKESAEWENLNFPVNTAYKLVLSDGNLYVAAGYYGLYYLEGANPKNKWQYLGHKVTEESRHAESGVQAINIYGITILIGYIDTPEQKDGSRVGIWRSEDMGKTWVPSDEGIRTEELNYSSALFLTRSPYDSNRLLTSSFGEIYYSEDGGKSWNAESSDSFQAGTSILKQGFKWHPLDPEIIWTYGENGYFQPFLGKSENFGKSWEIFLDVQVPEDNAFFDMVFDAADPDLIYVGAQGAVLKSDTGGAEWTNGGEVEVVFTDPKGNFFKALEAISDKAGALFAAAGPRLYVSRNEGEHVTIIETPDQLSFINDLVYNESKKVLYVAGEHGVFKLKNPYQE